MPSATGESELEQTRTRPKIWRNVLILGLLIAGFLIILFASRLAAQGWVLYQSARQIESALQSDPSTNSLPIVSEQVEKITATTSAIERQLSPLSPLLSRLEGMTAYGSTAAAMPQLLEAGVGFLDVANRAMGVLTPALLDADEDLSLEVLAAVVNETGPELALLAPRAESASAQLAAIDATQLHPDLAEPFGEMQAAASLLSAGLRMAPHLSELLGFDEPQTYLILIQNNHELRATGGFISAIGRLTVDQGRIAELDFQDSYEYFSREDEYAPAPTAMQTYMDIPLLLLRDANWSPDLPTTAQLVRSMVQKETGVEVDGIVTVDLHAVERLVDALGRLRVEGIEQPVTGDNIAEIVTTLWAQPLGTDAEADAESSGEWWQERKSFVPALANAALARIESGNIDMTAIASAAGAALDSRDVQVWLADSETASIFNEAGWDGAIAPVDSADYLALVDTNMGYNKVNAVLEREMKHQVAWPDAPDDPATATTTITYRHPVELAGHECDQTPRYGETYEEMTARCYFSYVRLYVPGGSQLIDAEGFERDSVISKRGERGTEVLAGWFVLPPGEEHTVSFTYRLPVDITDEPYRLFVQRQSGTNPLPLNGWIGSTAFDTVIESGRYEWQPE